MVVEVYVDLLSEPCRSVIIFLKHTGISYKVVNVDLINGKTKSVILGVNKTVAIFHLQ